MESHKIPWFQTTNQKCIHTFPYSIAFGFELEIHLHQWDSWENSWWIQQSSQSSLGCELCGRIFSSGKDHQTLPIQIFYLWRNGAGVSPVLISCPLLTQYDTERLPDFASYPIYKWCIEPGFLRTPPWTYVTARLSQVLQ